MTNIEAEILRRLNMWELIQRSPNWPLVKAAEIRELSLYGGASGVWVDKSVTQSISSEGVAVSVLHTGKHYDDDYDETGILYHYPTTMRVGLRDTNEIEALKNAKWFNIPVFVIKDVGEWKTIELAWLTDFDDDLRICVLAFVGTRPGENTFDASTSIIRPPDFLFGPRRTSKVEVERAERDPQFKFNIVKRFRGRCLVTSLDVTEMLDAAHILPVSSGGTEAIDNGLLLSAGVHRAFDAGLWAINPRTLRIETKSHGPDAVRMKLSEVDLNQSSHLLNRDALEYRYEKLFIAGKRK